MNAFAGSVCPALVVTPAERLLGLDEVPTIVLGGLTEVQRRQLVLADNRIALNAGLDLEMLSLELKTWPLLVPTWRDSASPLENLPGPSPHHDGLTDEDEVPTQCCLSHRGDLVCGLAPDLLRRQHGRRRRLCRHRQPAS